MWHLWRCTHCSSVFLDPRPDDESIPRTYESYYTHAAPDPDSYGRGLPSPILRAINAYLVRAFGWRTQPPAGEGWGSALGAMCCAAYPPLADKLDYLGRHLFLSTFPNRGRLLDVGCGNGEFLGIAARMGWEPFGIEPDPAARQACRDLGYGNVYASLGDVPADLLGRMDVATCSHVIEHVPDPGALLQSVKGLMGAGAMIWIATPNPQGPGSRLFGRTWRGLEPSRHLCVPSQAQLRVLLDLAGFSEVRLHARGSHGKTIVGESAKVVALERRSGMPAPLLSRFASLPLRAFLGTIGAVVPALGDETVITAKLPVENA